MKVRILLVIILFFLIPLRFSNISKAQFSAKDCSRTSTSTIPHIGFELIPLNDMNASQYYPSPRHVKRQEGGLYGNGINSVEFLSSHYQQAIAANSEVVPRDVNGNPSANGKIGVVAIGMSNTRREFNTFTPKAESDPAKSNSVVFVNAAQESMVASSWAGRSVSSQSNPWPWDNFDSSIISAGLTPAQVQVAWIKLTNADPQQPGSDDFPVYSQTMLNDMRKVVQYLKEHTNKSTGNLTHTNIKVAYLSTRMYGGYSLIPLSPEPSVYESAFAMRWLIQEQIDGGVALSPVTYNNAPVLLWGPYFWANGLIPRSDGLTWTCNDMASDGVHPEESAKQKISDRLLDFFKQDSLAKVWFTGSGTLPTITPSTSVTQTPAPTPGDVPGDGDSNGKVDGLDFIIWLTHYGQFISGVNNGDYDGNDQIGIGDYLIWATNFRP